MPRPKALLALLALPALLTIGLTACSKKEDTSSLPDGAALVSESANAMKSVTSSQSISESVQNDSALLLPLSRADVLPRRP